MRFMVGKFHIELSYKRSWSSQWDDETYRLLQIAYLPINLTCNDAIFSKRDKWEIVLAGYRNLITWKICPNPDLHFHLILFKKIKSTASLLAGAYGNVTLQEIDI